MCHSDDSRCVTPVERFQELDARLIDAGSAHIYDGSYCTWPGACNDAGRRMLGFTDAHG